MNHVSRHSNENMEELFEAILSLRDMEECRAFFSDLCTMQELMLLSQRLQVAKLLLAGETYEKIRSQVSVSSSTITRINMAPAATGRCSTGWRPGRTQPIRPLKQNKVPHPRSGPLRGCFLLFTGNQVPGRKPAPAARRCGPFSPPPGYPATVPGRSP